MLSLLVAAGVAQAAESTIMGQSLNLGPDSDDGGLRIEAATKNGKLS